MLSYAICIAALIWGGKPEQTIALVYLVVFKGANILRATGLASSFSVTEIDWLSAGSDITAAVGFVIIAVNANRNYPLWIAAFQLVSVAGHLARELLEAMTPIAYVILVVGPSHFITILMAIGLFRHIRRKKEFGRYRDWRWLSAREESPIEKV